MPPQRWKWRKYAGVHRTFGACVHLLAHALELPYALLHGIDRAISDAAPRFRGRDLHPYGCRVGAGASERRFSADGS
jgi:hypothetical protein